jgi:hypothetical protein
MFQGSALIWIAGDCGIEGAAAAHQKSVELMHQQLLQSGFADDSVVVLQQSETTQLTSQLQSLANAAAEETTLLVILLGIGVNDNSSDALVNPLGLQQPALSIQSVLDVLSTSASRRQIVICDGTISDEKAAEVPATSEFGTGELKLSDGQTAVVGRISQRLSAATGLCAALADSLTELADDDDDTQISFAELHGYLLRFCSTYNLSPLPAVFGNISSEFPVARAAALSEVGRMSLETRTELAVAQLEDAYQSLLVEKQPATTQESLQRAIRLRPDQKIQKELIQLWLTSLCTDLPDVEIAQAEAQKRGVTLHVLLKPEAATSVSDLPSIARLATLDSRNAVISATFQTSLNKSLIAISPASGPATVSREQLRNQLFLTKVPEQADNSKETLRLVALLEQLLQE